MQNRVLQVADVSKACAVYVTSSTPRWSNTLPESIRTAFIIFQEELYFLNRDDPKSKCTLIKSFKPNELKLALGINDITLEAGKAYNCLCEKLSSEQLKSISIYSGYYQSGLQKIVIMHSQIVELRNESWNIEDKLFALEKRIKALEDLCPNKYKNVISTHADFKNIKLEELKKRIENLESVANKQYLETKINELRILRSEFDGEKTGYLKLLDYLQEKNDQCDEYSKRILIDEQNRNKIRADINKLSIELRMQAVSQMHTTISFGVLMDMITQLKKMYEVELNKTYVLATGTILKQEIFEQLFADLFQTSIKMHFRNFANKPTAEMSSVKEEIETLAADVCKKLNIPSSEYAVKLEQYLKTLLYLACILETYRFTDKVQRLDLASAITGRMGSLFGVEDIAGEFMNVLSATQIQNSFAMMPFAATTATPIEGSSLLWLEMAIWIYGLHQAAVNQISPRLKDRGIVTPEALTYINDNDDRKFYENKPPLLKWLLAQYHELHCKNVLHILPPDVWAEMMPFLSETFKVLPPSQPILQIEEEKMTEPSQNVGTSPCLFQPKPVAKVEPTLRPVLQLDDLDRIKHLPISEKLPLFNALLLKCDFNQDQHLCIQSYKEQMVGVLNEYKSAYFTSNYVPTFLCPRKHIEVVTSAYDKMQKDLTSRECLLQIYIVYAKAVSENSPDIGPKTEKILNHCFNMLHTISKPVDENKRNFSM